MITSTEQLKEAFALRAASAGMSIECGMSGSYLAEIAVVSDYPGATELAQGLPLVGAAGSVFWNAARDYAKIKRTDCYVTNLSKRSVAGMITDTIGNKRALSKSEVAAWGELLTWELAQLPNLKYIVILGGYALEGVLGKTDIASWRGSVLSHNINARPVTVVTANNPAMCIRDPKTLIAFRMDMDKFRRVLTGEFKEHKINVRINPSIKEALQYISHVRNAGIPIATDIETVNMETACIGFANSAHEAMCIPFRNASGDFYTQEEELKIRLAIQGLYLDPRVRLVMQNGHFDCSWLWYKDLIRVRRVYFDTMLAHHALYPTMPHNLGFICTQYTDHPYYKDEKDDWRSIGDIDAFWEYNGKDCAITYAAHEAMLAELKEQGLHKFFIEHIMRVQEHLVRMTVVGVKADMSLKEKLTAELQADLNKQLAQFHSLCQELTGDPTYAPNPNSPKQMTELYFSKLKLVGRGTSTDAANRETMYKHPRTSPKARELLTAINRYAENHKFFSTYVSSQADPDGRIRCEYKQIGVQRAPGRLSSGQTMWGSGMNLQNQPDRAKAMFIADPGYCFVYGDGSQAEARVVGWKANIRTWIEQFERARLEGGYDAHCALAADMFGIPYNDVPTFDRYDEKHPVRPGDRVFPGDVTVRFVAKRCHDSLTEVLTPQGWVRIAVAARTNTPIMGWRQETDALQFEIPTAWYQEDVVDEGMFLFSGPNTDLKVTGDHEMPYTKNGKKDAVYALVMWGNPWINYGRAPFSGDTYASMTISKTQPYTGKVFCPTMPSGGFLVRRNGKVTASLNCRHGLNYRMMPERLAATTGLPINISAELFNLYHKQNPELKDWWKATENEVRATGKLFNVYGRRYLQLEPPTQEALESIVAFYPQSTVGDWAQRVIYKCHDDPRWPKTSMIVLNIHDAVIALSKIGDWKTTARLMKRHAEEPMIINDRPLIIPMDIAVSKPDADGVHRWSTIEKIKPSELDK